MTGTENPPSSGQITELLRRWSDGESESLEPLFNLVYPRLRQIANALFRGEAPDSLLTMRTPYVAGCVSSSS